MTMRSLRNFKNKYVLLVAVAAGVLTSCNKDKQFDFNGDETSRVFFNIENNTVNGYNRYIFAIKHWPASTTGPDIIASFPARMTQEAGQDVKVSYGVDNAKVAEYNAANKTNYLTVPDGVVALGAELTIPKGELISSANVQFSIPRDKMPLLTGAAYLVPLSITSVNGDKVAASSNVGTVYIVINTTTTNEFQRTAWTIHSVNSQETTGEGPNNGRAIFLLDDVLSTFWHTQWNGAEPPLPHHVAVNMNASQSLSGVYITGRQNATNGSPRTIVVDVSTDGVTWQNAGTYEVLATNAKQTLTFSQKYTASYFRITVTATYGNTRSTFLSELSAF